VAETSQFRLLQPVLLHSINQGAARDIEVLRGTRLIPAMFYKRLAQDRALHLFKINPVICDGAWRRRRGLYLCS
jgi:hypothetical protein